MKCKNCEYYEPIGFKNGCGAVELLASDIEKKSPLAASILKLFAYYIAHDNCEYYDMVKQKQREATN